METIPFKEYPIAWITKIVFDEQQYKCNSCGLDKWMESMITLELEHKDGNNKNNERDNLELLCPNCHSLTHTWRGRNKRTTKRVTDEEMLSALKEHPNIRQALISLNLSPKGNNYLRANALLL
jgi:5-methylcytosine-specific restriction endonuclease McrA